MTNKECYKYYGPAIMQELKEKILKYQYIENVSNRTLAIRAGVSRNTIDKILYYPPKESGCTVDVFYKICRMINANPNEIFMNVSRETF